MSSTLELPATAATFKCKGRGVRQTLSPWAGVPTLLLPSCAPPKTARSWLGMYGKTTLPPTYIQHLGFSSSTYPRATTQSTHPPTHPPTHPYTPSNPASPLWKIKAHTKTCSSFAFSPLAPGLLATCGMDKTVKLWDYPADGASPPRQLGEKAMSVGKLFTINFYPRSVLFPPSHPSTQPYTRAPRSFSTHPPTHPPTHLCTFPAST